MKKLYLDDTRIPDPSFNFHVVRSYDEFTNWILKNGMPDMISFDHDLGDEHAQDLLKVKEHGGNLDYDHYEEKCGYHALKWLIHFCFTNALELPWTYCHSMNPVGADKIVSLCNNYYKIKKLEKQCTRHFWKHTNIEKDE